MRPDEGAHTESEGIHNAARHPFNQLYFRPQGDLVVGGEGSLGKLAEVHPRAQPVGDWRGLSRQQALGVKGPYG